MVRVRSGKTAVVVVILLIAVVAIVGFVIVRKKPAPETPTVAKAPVTAPTTAPATKPATAPAPPPKDLLGVVRAANPDYPTTQELDLQANYEQAAHLVIDEPVYLCPAGHLWITHPRGQDTAAVLDKADDGN